MLAQKQRAKVTASNNIIGRLVHRSMIVARGWRNSKGRKQQTESRERGSWEKTREVTRELLRRLVDSTRGSRVILRSYLCERILNDSNLAEPTKTKTMKDKLKMLPAGLVCRKDRQWVTSEGFVVSRFI